jgi:hypothetical protein
VAFSQQAEGGQDTWVVGIASLKGVNLSAQNRYLVHSIPLLFMESIQNAIIHRFTAEEKNRYGIQRREAALREQRKKIREIKDRQEREFFQSGGEYQREPFAAELQRAYAKLDSLKAEEADTVSPPGEVGVILRQGQEIGGLMSPPVFSPAEYARMHNLDLFFWGEIEEIQEYLLVRIYGYHTLLSETAFRYEDAATVESLSGMLEAMTEQVARDVRGGDTATLTIVTEPPGCTVEINGRWLGSGPLERVAVDPGEAAVRVSRTGYREALAALSLEPGEERELVVSLSPLDLQEVRISSLPSGANVYLGALWQGTTPLTLAVPPEKQHLLVKKEGYREEGLLASPEMPEEVTVALKQELFDEGAWQKRRRDIFYGSLGAFALSLPVPLFLYSLAVDSAYAGLRETIGSPAYDTFIRRTELFYYGYLGTLFVSVTLFINMGVDLLEYVSRAF